MTKDEFDRIVHQHQGLIWKICRSFSDNEEDQKDLFQEILYTLWRGKDSFLGDSKVTTWMYKVSLNRAIDLSRKKTIRTTGLNPLTTPASTKEPDYDVEALYMAINKLAPLNRAIIILYLEQLSYKEIGEIMGLSEKNVSVKLVRIKEQLKEHYLQATKIVAS